MRTRRPTPTSGPAESTVSIDVENMDVDGVSVRVYDCDGQVRTSILRAGLVFSWQTSLQRLRLQHVSAGQGERFVVFDVVASS